MNIIFIVEDNNADVRLIQETLKDMSQEVKIRFFYDGESAIEFLSGIKDIEWAPLGIILDINMPKIDGFDVLHFIRKNKILADIPVVMLTSSDDETDIKKAESLHAGYFVKPYDFDEFKGLMTSIFEVFHVC